MALRIGCHYAECCDCLNVMLSVVMVNVVMLSVVMLSIAAPIKSIFYDFSYFIEGATEKVYTFLMQVSEYFKLGNQLLTLYFFQKQNNLIIVMKWKS
jgi:hypothetical protein